MLPLLLNNDRSNSSSPLQHAGLCAYRAFPYKMRTDRVQPQYTVAWVRHSKKQNQRPATNQNLKKQTVNPTSATKKIRSSLPCASTRTEVQDKRLLQIGANFRQRGGTGRTKPGPVGSKLEGISNRPHIIARPRMCPGLYFCSPTAYDTFPLSSNNAP